MRNFLLASSVAATAVISSGEIFAGDQQLQSSVSTIAVSRSNSETVVPSESTFPKQIDRAQTIKSVENITVTDQLRDLIENRLQQYVPQQQDRTGVEAFYRKREFSPLWTGAGQLLTRAQQAADFLRGVAADGLDPEDYPTPRFSDANPSQLAADELTLTNSVAVFVRHASTGRVAFSRVSTAIYFDLKPPDLEQVLEKLAVSGDLRDTLESFNPQRPEYKALKAELGLTRHVVGAEQDIVAERSGAVTRKRESIAARIDTIVANMERWRWLPHELGTAYVMVNVPDYTLKVVNHEQAVWSTRIVVGRPGQYATPLLAETMKNITINPTWNVPPSIIRNEYLPALERDPNSLARIGLKIERDRDGSIHIYQPPSERNALGRIRFNFPNRFLVYQHDTPNKNLFQKMSRAYSHGCMRVESPDKYAEVLLSISQPEQGNSVGRIRALYGTSEQTIDLKNPIPVYITYQTAFVDDSGQLKKRPDIYDLDQVITNLMKRDREAADISIVRNHGTTKKLLAYFPKRDREVADIPSSRHYGRTNKLTARLPITKKKPRIAEPHFGWVSTWGWNYFEDRRSAYAPFNQFRSW